MKRLAIVQSNYIPWKGYFDLIASVDEFVLYDDVQYTRRDWRNRNKIKTRQGVQWMTIPVEVSGQFHQKVKDTVVSEANWGEKHWRTLIHNYARAPHFDEYREALQRLYSDTGERHLSNINRAFIAQICDWLGIRTKLSASMDYTLDADEKNDRLLQICRQAGATTYLSGPSAAGYLDPEAFRSHGIELELMSYDGYPEYEQLHPPFEHGVTVLDLLFHTGREAPKYMKFGRRG